MKKVIVTLSAIVFCGLTLQADDVKPTTGDKPATGEKPKMTKEEQFKKLDTNSDGSISKEEFMASPQAKKDAAKAEERFTKLDKDKDGKLSLEEFSAAGAKKAK